MTGAAVDAEREALIEMVAEADEKLMEKFFEAGTLTDEELIAGLAQRDRRGQGVPAGVHVGDAEHRRPAAARRRPGVPAFAGRSRRSRARTSPAPRSCKTADDKAPPSAFVWKTIADPFAGRITMFRVVSGSLKSDSTVQNKTKDAPERLGTLQLLQGKTQTPVPEIKAGDLGAVAKLKDTLTDDTLGDKSRPDDVPADEVPGAGAVVRHRAEEPRRRRQDQHLDAPPDEEDPSIGYSRDPQTKELLLAGQGQLHIEVTVAKLKRRFGVDVNLKPPRIPYRETIKAATEAHGRHKKQTGGHGQFGDCKIKVEPLPGAPTSSSSTTSSAARFPGSSFRPSRKGIQDARTRGYLAGFPMVDFRVTVFDGSYHDVDSNELSFKLAGSLAFKDAMTRARPTILEPVMNVEVYAPSDYAGDLMGDLNGRRGRIGGMDTRGATTIIKAQVPMSEMLTYEQHLTSATGGRGSYHMEYSHYDEVPSHLQTKIIAAARAERGQEAVEEA